MSHRDIFQPLSTINYDTISFELAKDLPLLEDIYLPDASFAHIYEAKGHNYN